MAGTVARPETVAGPRSRWATVAGASIWLTTLVMDLSTASVTFTTDFFQQAAAANGVVPTSAQLLVIYAAIVALVAITIGYATVGALLAGRVGAGRIPALLLAGGALFALVPFGYIVGGRLAYSDPTSALFNAFLLVGPVAIGPGYAMILPGVAITFPDGHLPSPRWRWPVLTAAITVVAGTLLQLVRPDALQGVAGGARANPFAIEGLPAVLANLAFPIVGVGVLAATAIGVAAVVVRYRRGDPVARQQLRWFLAAVSVAAVPLALTFSPIGGPETGLLAGLGLMLVPIAVWVAVTRYRLYEIDHLISRTLVYVPLTALLAGLYAATVTLLQRVFQAVTGDRSDAAIIISTLILASVFTPVRKWLEGIVERRFKPVTPDGQKEFPARADEPDWEARVAAVALRVVRAELDEDRAGRSRRRSAQ